MINLPSALAITKANVKAAATNNLNMLVSGWQFQWLDNLNCQDAFLEYDELIVLSIIQPFLYEVYQLSYRWTDCTRLFIFAKSVIVKLLLHMYFQYHCSSFLDIRVTSNGVDISKSLPLYLKSILLRKITSPTFIHILSILERMTTKCIWLPFKWMRYEIFFKIK